MRGSAVKRGSRPRLGPKKGADAVVMLCGDTLVAADRWRSESDSRDVDGSFML